MKTALKTAEEYKTSLMWCGGNTLYEKIEWTLNKRDQEIKDRIDEMKRKDILDDPFKDGWNKALTELKESL